MATLGLSEAEREAIARLERDVIEPSMTALVILEFCTQPSPVLEKLVAARAAKGVKLVRLDIAKDRLIAAQFRVQSVPTVYAFYQGQPVADISSYRSEAQLTTVLDQLLTQLKFGGESAAAEQAEIEPLMAMGEQILADGDGARAVSIFRQIQEMAPKNPGAGGWRGAVAAANREAKSGSPRWHRPTPITRGQRAQASSTWSAATAADSEDRGGSRKPDDQRRVELVGQGAEEIARGRDALIEIARASVDEGAARKPFSSARVRA